MKQLLVILLLLFISYYPSSAQTKTDTLKTDSAKTYRLNEVTIKNKIPIVQVMTDKVLLNVESMPGSAGLNALELLRQSPGVSVDGQDNVKMSGKKGIQVMIDGRLQVVSGQQLATLLKSMPATNIKTIEIIANPSAKYDAAGNAGIINLILKKASNNGTTANLTAGYQFTEHFRQNASFSINARSNKLLLFANGSYDNSLQHTTVSSTRILSDKTFLQNGIERQGYSNPNIRAGFEYILSEKSRLGAIISLQHEWEDFPSDAQTLVTGSSSSLLSTATIANNTQDRIGTNLNYQYTDTIGNTLNAEADWTGYRSRLNNNVSNSFINGETADFTNNTQTQISLYSLKGDYSYKKGSMVIETGLKASASKTDNLLAASQTGANSQPLISSNFDYREQIFAGYASAKQQLGKWSLHAGLRTELTQMKGVIGDNSSNTIPLRDTTYLSLFPTVFIRYKLSEKNSIGLNYSRRIDRPSFQDQNPYTYRTDFYYATQGNPLLLPQFTNSLSADIAINGQMQIKLNYSQTRGLIETITTQNEDQTLAIPINAGKRSLINLSFSSPFTLSKFWSGYASIEPSYQFYSAKLNGYPGLATIKNSGAGLNASLSNSFILSKTWKAGISGWFNYASRTSIYKNSPIYSVDLSAKKTLFEGKGTLSLAYRDLLNTQRVRQRALAGNIDQTSIRKWESTGAYIGFGYNIGNAKIKNTSSNKGKTEEQNRIKGRN